MATQALTSSTVNHARIHDMAAEGFCELMADYGITLSPRVGCKMSPNEPVLFGIIGFVGSGAKATCLLGAEQRLVMASCRAHGLPRDWIAELANQLVGRVKMKLLASNVSVTLTTPLALSGVQLTPLPRLALEPVSFSSVHGAALICLELELEAHFALAAEQPLGVAPGECVF